MDVAHQRSHADEHQAVFQPRRQLLFQDLFQRLAHGLFERPREDIDLVSVHPAEDVDERLFVRAEPFGRFTKTIDVERRRVGWELGGVQGWSGRRGGDGDAEEIGGGRVGLQGRRRLVPQRLGVWGCRGGCAGSRVALLRGAVRGRRLAVGRSSRRGLTIRCGRLTIARLRRRLTVCWLLLRRVAICRLLSISRLLTVRSRWSLPVSRLLLRGRRTVTLLDGVRRSRAVVPRVTSCPILLLLLLLGRWSRRCTVRLLAVLGRWRLPIGGLLRVLLLVVVVVRHGYTHSKVARSAGVEVNRPGHHSLSRL